MKVLAVLSDLTCPPREGLHEQTLLLMQALQDQGVALTLYSFCKDAAVLDIRELEQGYGLRLAAPPMIRRGPLMVGGLVNRLTPRFLLANEVKALLAEAAGTGHETVYLEGVLAAGIWRSNIAARTVINFVDPPSRRWMRMAAAASRPLARVASIGRAALSLALESLVKHPSTRWNVVSPSDADYLRTRHGHSNTSAIPVMLPTMPDTEVGAADAREPVRCCIIADLRQRHMQDAVEWFFEDVLHPAGIGEDKISVEVLGRTEPTEQLLAAADGLPVRFVAWVHDFAAYVRGSDIIVLPDTVGTGLKNRAIQGLAFGRAVLATDVAFEGVSVTNGVHALVGNRPAELIEGLRRLVHEPDLRDRVATAGRSFALQNYSGAAVARRWIERLTNPGTVTA